jgi:hypothetical protein
MDTNVEVLTFASPEIAEFLSNNRIDLISLLTESGYGLTGRMGTDPACPGSKDAVLVILATAALAATLEPAFKKCLDGVLYRPVKVTEVVPVQVLDKVGQPVVGADGIAQVEWVEKTKLLERVAPKEQVRIKTGFMGFKFEYESTPR